MGNPQEQQQPSGLARAVAVAGSQKNLAARIGVAPPSLNEWVTNGVPTLRCPAIEQATGVRCEELRPDVFWVRDGADVIGIVDSINTDVDPAYVAQCIRNQAGIQQPGTITTSFERLPFGIEEADVTIGDRIAAVLLTDPFKTAAECARHAGLAKSTLSELISGRSKSSAKLHLIAEYLGVNVEWLSSGRGHIFAVDTKRQQGSALDASAMAKPRPSTVAPVSAEPMVFLVDHGTTVDQCLSVAAQLFQQTEDIFEHECEDFSASTYGAWQLMRFGVRLVADAHLKLIAFEKGLPE